MAPRILVVDDEEELRISVEKVLRKAGYAVDLAGTAAQAVEMLRRGGYHLLVTDFRLPDGDGLELMRQARAIDPDIEAIVITAFGNVPLAVDAIKQGAYDFLIKPFKRAELERGVERALEKQRLAAENRRLKLALSQTEGPQFIGESDAARKLMQVVEQVASSSATVLLTGESGTGKELVADAIHRLSPRRDNPLIKVNCAALPETLLEAELFGHERGAFTGAVGRRDGRFALAHRGTLFLDEVSTLTPAVQVKLLRVLQDGAFEPLGSTRTVRADVRLVAASNVDLAVEVAQGRFREDLFYRLNVITVTVPPLRERVDDIAPLAQHFLRLYAARNGKHLDGISRQALARLQQWRWPGNVRELEHAIERAVVMTTGPTIELQHLPEALRGARPDNGAADEAPVVRVPIGTPLEDVERLLIRETLRQTGGNKRRAAHLLGIATRTIYRKL
ncbi:MAG: sigma-54 dependent transcriptional regulator [Vicinamibacteraceae bacterium]|nr:sigma-54 dependent transcriptional regulator [Vicinamibacteraceae bacterium]